MDEQFKEKILEVYDGSVDHQYWDCYFCENDFTPILFFNEPGKWEAREHLNIDDEQFESRFLDAYMSGCNISIETQEGFDSSKLRKLRKIGLLKGICSVTNSKNQVCDFGSVTIHWHEKDFNKMTTILSVVRALLLAHKQYTNFGHLYLNSKFRSVDRFLEVSAPLLDPLILLNNCSHSGEYTESFVNYFLLGAKKTSVNILAGLVDPNESIDKVFDLLSYAIKEEDLYLFVNQRYELRGFYESLK